jgi:signal transduction histidine kinase
MRTRAEELGGTFAITGAEPHGTTLTWTVPVAG